MLKMSIGFGISATDVFNCAEKEIVNINLFGQDETKPMELRLLDSYQQQGYVITSTKLKTEFRNFRSLLIKVHSNRKMSGQGEREDDGPGCKQSNYNVFSTNFIDFCQGEMPLYYTCCACTKFGLLHSAFVSMTLEAQHRGSNTARIYTPELMHAATALWSRKR